MSNTPFNILAISGSLREKSSNSVLLRAVMAMVPSQYVVINYTNTSKLPHFNPDIDLDDVDPAVSQWRNDLKKADGILICTPEYAKGIPGSLKNGLDWVVSSGEFVNKPIAVISASPHPDGGKVALASLVGTLLMINAVVVERGTLAIPFVTLKLGKKGEIIDEETRLQLMTLLDSLFKKIDGDF